MRLCTCVRMLLCTLLFAVTVPGTLGASCDTHTTACSCAAEPGCVWYVYQDEVHCGPGSPQFGPDLFTLYPHGNGGSFSRDGLNFFGSCWWPSTFPGHELGCKDMCPLTQFVNEPWEMVQYISDAGERLFLSPNVTNSLFAISGNIPGSERVKGRITKTSVTLEQLPQADMPDADAALQIMMGQFRGTSISDGDGAVMLLQMPLWFKYSTVEHPDGYDPDREGASPVNEMRLNGPTTFAWRKNVDGWEYPETTQVYTGPNGETFTHVCRWSDTGLRKTANDTELWLKPREVKCDLTTAGVNVGADEAIAVVVVLRSIMLSEVPPQTDRVWRLASGVIEFAENATSASPGGGETRVVRSKTKACDFEGERAWFIERRRSSDIKTTAAALGGRPISCRTFVASFASGGNGNWVWDPKLSMNSDGLVSAGGILVPSVAPIVIGVLLCLLLAL